MSNGVHDAAASSKPPAGSSSPSSRPQDGGDVSASDETAASIQFRNGIASPGSPGSEADSTINSTTFAPSILASRLGRSLYSSAGAAGSSLSLTGSGFNSPSLALTGFNAVSTVLNNPSKRQHPIDPKSSRFPPITPNHVPAEIPKIKKAELDSYLSTVRPEWDRFMRNQSMGRQGKATIEQQQQQQQQQRSLTQDPSYDSEPLGKTSKRHRSTASMASLSADLQAVPPPQARKKLPSLSAVPQVFFAEDFDLGNPYTFDQVTERYKVMSTSPAEQNGGVAPTYDVALNQMLQEKLSYYSDVIEQHLIIEIGAQSSSFFAALENLNDLNAEAESCLRKIDALKTELETIDDQQAKKGLRIIREQQHRRQLEHKQAAVQNVRQIIERRDLVRLLLQQGETEEALELLNKLKMSLRRFNSDKDHQLANTIKPSRTSSTNTAVNLSNLECLATIPSQLEEMERTLSGMLEQDLLAILKHDIDARLEAYRQHSASTQSPANDAARSTEASDQPDRQTAALGTLMIDTNIEALDTLLTPSKQPASPFGYSSRALTPNEAQLSSQIAPLVDGLAKTGGIEKAVAAYREVAIQAIQETWKQTLSQASTDMAEAVKWLLSEESAGFDDHENLPGPVARIRDLEHGSFLKTGRELFEILMQCLRIIDAQCKLISRISDKISASNTSNTERLNSESGQDGGAAPKSEESSSELALPSAMPQRVPTNLLVKLSDMVGASAEEAHVLCARLLALRATTHATLELPPFLVVFQLCWSFVLSSEQLCRKMIVGLRGTVLSQAKGFLANFHRRRIERAAKAVEEETWAQADVGVEIQAQIHQIVSSAVEDPADFVIVAGEGSAEPSNRKQAEAESRVTESTDTASAPSSKTLNIEDRQYFVVDASLDVLSLLVDYLKVIINLPLLTTEAMARVVEFLKQFNSRTCQVVLGAGAMRSAGLKNITAKHLALASQSLSIMISLIPYIRETVRRHLSPKQAVMLTEFDKLRRDFQEHQYEIHAKLVAIMSDRLTVHCRTLSTIDWNADKATADRGDGDDQQEDEPNKYAADLVKETATLHKVLSKYLQAVVVEHVIGQVLRAIDSRLAQEFDRIPVQNSHALDRMQTDVRFLGTKLSTLKHVEWKDEALQQVLSTKRVATPATVSVTTSAGPSTPNNEAAPGSPAIDKPTVSPFGPVTYKPRIPNIFARRQQQQQQQSQSGSPRASTDVPGTSTPVEAPRSVETTPRTSLQLQQQQQQAAILQESTTGEHQRSDVSTPQPPAKTESPGAKSIQDEVSDIPPTPPSKSKEMEATALVEDENGDTRVSVDLVTTIVPAPDAVDKASADGEQPSSVSPGAPADAAAAPATASLADSVAEPIEHSDTDADHADATVSEEQSEEAGAKSVSPMKPELQKEERSSVESVQHSSQTEPSTANHPDPAASVSTIDTDATEPPGPLTPTKGAGLYNVSHDQHASVGTSTGTPAESSPARSGASTPATGTPSGTPVKPGRMSLKERLAEAARKRAQQSTAARPSSQAGPQANVDPPASAAASGAAVSPKSSEPGPSAAAADTPARDERPSEEVQSVTSPGPAEARADVPTGTSALSATEQNVVQPNLEDSAASNKKEEDVNVPKGSELASEPAVPEAAHSTREAGEDRVAADAAVATSTKPDDAEEAHPSADKPAPSTPIEEAEKDAGVANGTETPSTVTREAERKVDADAEEGGEGDEAEAEAEADANEGTVDSSLGSAPSAGGKKNKKKKKGKKK